MRQQVSKNIDPWAAMDALVKQEAEPTGLEWFTVMQFAERYGLSENGAYGKITNYFRAGKLERWKGTGFHCRRTLTKYRPIVAKPLDKQR